VLGPRRATAVSRVCRAHKVTMSAATLTSEPTQPRPFPGGPVGRLVINVAPPGRPKHATIFVSSCPAVAPGPTLHQSTLARLVADVTALARASPRRETFVERLMFIEFGGARGKAAVQQALKARLHAHPSSTLLRAAIREWRQSREGRQFHSLRDDP
jgi:hypothetical protein